MNKVLGICNLHDGPNLGRLSANTTLGCLLMRFNSMEEMLDMVDNSSKWIKVVLKQNMKVVIL